MHPPLFLLEALVYLAAAVVAVPLSKRLGLGSVLGYLVAGVVIGPWGLALLPDVESVLRVSELGVVLLLFLIGLELRPQRLWALRRAIFGLGALQVGATLALVALAARLGGAGWPLAFALGAAVSMSSTAIALQLLAERRLMDTPAGRSAFSVSLFQDLAVVPLMLGVGLLAPGPGGPHGAIDWRAVATAAGLVVALVAAGRLLLRPLLRLVADTGMREVFVACALLVVVGSAWLTSSVGLSLALGSFIAGVLLADSEYRMELEVDIEPFKGLLLGLFFIAVGMSIDLSLVAAQLARVVALTAAAVALKLAVLLVLARVFRLAGAEGWILALSISQIGEFGFVLSSSALAARLLAPADAALLNAVVALSMLGTPVLFFAYDRLIGPRLAAGTNAARAPRIDERNAVIVAGVGRFGQIVARLLLARGVDVTIIDRDPDQIELLRQFGWRLHYGDVSRPDVLDAAGARQARLLVLAIDDPDTLLRTARHVRAHHPHLALVARARSRTDAFELAALGVPFVRETFGSALDAAEQALTALGATALSARRAVRRFRRHDELLLREAFAYRGDRERLIALSARGRRDLERLLRDEHGARAPGPTGDER